MPFPAELIGKIQIAVDNVLADGQLNPQQQTFVNHIQKISTELTKAISPIPETEHALQRIIPSFGDSFLQQQAALFGYAKLLLEHPQSFEDAILSEYQQDQMRLIYQYGQRLYDLTEQIQQTALTERRKQHRAKPAPTDLSEFFAQEDPILRYFLRKHPIQLDIHAEPIIVKIVPYHLAAFIQHIVSTMSSELIDEQGQIRIGATQQAIHIFCTEIELNTSEQESLFKKNGRYAYPQRFIQDGGTIHFLRNAEGGATIQLVLPR